jgi:hypothetical protein
VLGSGLVAGSASRTISVHGVFVGAFLRSATSVGSFTASNGTTSRACPCSFESLTGPDALGAGDWTFAAQGAAVGEPRPLLEGADVTVDT